MGKIIDTIIGDIQEKKEYLRSERRIKTLPSEYKDAYKEIKQYILSTAGLLSMKPLQALVDLLEEAAANKKKVTDITGPDVAAFADELVRDTESYRTKQADKLNKKLR